jgi:hypothetical protein
MSRILFAVLVAGMVNAWTPRRVSGVEFVNPSAGFVARAPFAFPASALVGGIAYSPEGHPIIYENESGEIRLHGPESTPVLARFEPPVFGSFIVPLPDGSGVIFGESTAGNLYTVPYSGTGAVLLDNIPLAFDFAIAPDGRGFASALESSFNQIVLADEDPATAARVIVAGIPRFSGPLAFDDAGNLYYGTADISAAFQQLVRFPAARVQAAVAGDPIDYATEDLEVLADEIGGFYNLRWDRGQFYFTDLGFAVGQGGVYQIDPERNYLVTPLALFAHPEGILSPSYLAVHPGTVPYAAGAGPAGGTLLVSYANFSSVNSIAEIEPEVWFVRGRVNRDDTVDISDALALLQHLFQGGAPPSPLEAGNTNNDASLDIADAVYLLQFLFQSGRPIPSPYPEPGPDPE